MIASVLASLKRSSRGPRAFGGAIRLLLGAAAALVVIMAAVGYFDFPLWTDGEPEEVALPVEQEGPRRIENPRYTTRLASGAVLLISADWALPGVGGPDRIRLESVVARSEDAAGIARTARASVGYLSPRENTLLLTGGVEFFGGEGQRMAASRMIFDTEANTILAEGPVIFEAPGTRVEAGQAKAHPMEAGWRSFLEGGVYAVYAGTPEEPAP